MIMICPKCSKEFIIDDKQSFYFKLDCCPLIEIFKKTIYFNKNPKSIYTVHYNTRYSIKYKINIGKYYLESYFDTFPKIILEINDLNEMIRYLVKYVDNLEFS